MTRERDMPSDRITRIAFPTPAQLKYRSSGYERQFHPKGLDYWQRGLEFTWIWEVNGLEWYWYDQFWKFRGTREYWLRYVPYFWRNGSEFLKFEERFIKEATKGKGTISERDFIQMAESYKAKLNFGAIQGPLVSAVAAAGGAIGVVAATMSKINDIDNYQDMIKCGLGEKGYEEACAKVVTGAVMDVAKHKVSQ